MKTTLIAIVAVTVWHCLFAIHELDSATDRLWGTITVIAFQVRSKPSRTTQSDTLVSAHQSKAWIHQAIASVNGSNTRDNPAVESARGEQSCHLHVGNLDWTQTVADCESMIRQVLPDHTGMMIQFKPSTNRPRDIGKHHAGSAVLMFDTPAHAWQALHQLQLGQAALGQGGTLRVARVTLPPPLPDAVPDEPSPERVALRLERAASYGRRRERVAAATDTILANLLERENGTSRPLLFSPTVPLPVLHAAELDWFTSPFEIDPARGGGLHVGGTDHEHTNDALSGRATRKRAAVEAFLVVVRDALLDSDLDARPIHGLVADLGCGAGNLALPLAWWLRHERGDSFPTSGVLGVDINGFALQRLRDRTNRVATDSVRQENPLVVTLQQDLLNLLSADETVETPLYLSDAPFKFAHCRAVVSLHACGAASDLAIAAAVQYSLPFAISPCCIGNVMASRGAFNPSSRMPPAPSSINRSAAPSGTIQYPRSTWLQSQITPEEYHLLAAAADYGGPSTHNAHDADETARWRRSRLAKQVVEMDRLVWAEEHGYYVRMFELPRIGPLYSKREILLGAPRDSAAAHRIARLPTCTQ